MSESPMTGLHTPHDLFVTWRQLLVLTVSCVVACVTVPVGVMVFLIASHSSQPHVGSVDDREMLILERRLERIEDKLDHLLTADAQKLDISAKGTL